MLGVKRSGIAPRCLRARWRAGEAAAKECDEFGEGLVVVHRDGIGALVDQIPGKLGQVLPIVGEARGAPVSTVVLIVVRRANVHGPFAVFPDLQADILPREVFTPLFELLPVEVAAEVFPVCYQFGPDVGDAGEACFLVFHGG